ncbi:MAG: type II toxin-antitoxin system RelE/ParE family toxin [Alphaproteobacteria bacterium]|nr:type II toxin-antitoxin system RelE/ParE family toxin [Alphaproteobacteria bacterium]
MLEVQRTAAFNAWFVGLRDLRGRAQITNRIKRLAAGNAGDVRPVGSGVSEMRINTGPGYRVYFAARGTALVLLLAGGDKSSQTQDIETAKALAKEWESEAP